MRILHLTPDDKFIDHALPVFEAVFPKMNDVVVVSISSELKYVKSKVDHLIVKKSFSSRFKRMLSYDFFADYDLIIIHSLNSLVISELLGPHLKPPLVWLGWGYDYYDYKILKTDLHLPLTRQLLSSRKIGGKLKNLLVSLKTVFLNRIIKNYVIEKISIFSPVIPSEYFLLKNSKNWRNFPVLGQWNYGTLEDNLIKGFENQSVTGDSILVGNSASPTSNHLETFAFLRENSEVRRMIIAPLSYGDQRYAQQIIKFGDESFGDSFVPLVEFMPIEDYVKTIKQCGFVIMNHVRQQAVGNIIIMLYLGARVFLREENPTYRFFVDLGIKLTTVQELEKFPKLLSKPLSIEERIKNRNILANIWGRESAFKRTRLLVESALSFSSKS